MRALIPGLMDMAAIIASISFGRHPHILGGFGFRTCKT